MVRAELNNGRQCNKFAHYRNAIVKFLKLLTCCLEKYKSLFVPQLLIFCPLKKRECRLVLQGVIVKLLLFRHGYK